MRFVRCSLAVWLVCAFTALAGAQPRAVPPAVKTFPGQPAVKSPSPAPSASATRVAGRSIEFWKGQLSSEDPGKRAEAIISLIAFGEEAANAVPQILLRCKDTDVSPRIKAVIALRLIPAIHETDVPKVIDALCHRLNPTEEYQAGVRYEAAWSLRSYCTSSHAYQAIPALVAATKDKSSWEIRHTAMGSLWRIALESKGPPDRRIVQALIAGIHDPTFRVKLESIMGLGAVGRPADGDLKEQVASTLNLAATTRGFTVNNRIVAIWAYAGLVSMEHKEYAESALRGLARKLKDEDLEVRGQAAQALGALGNLSRSRVPELLAMLGDPESVVVYGACVALAQIGDDSDRVIDPLLRLLENKDHERATGAVGALSRLGQGNQKVIAAFEKQLERKDLNKRLRPLIDDGLERLKKPKKAPKAP